MPASCTVTDIFSTNLWTLFFSHLIGQCSMDELHQHAVHLWLCGLLRGRSRSHPLVLCSWAVLSGSKAGCNGCGRLFQLDCQLHHWHVLPICCCKYFLPSLGSYGHQTQERVPHSCPSLLPIILRNLIAFLLRTYVGHTSSWSSQHSFCSSSSSHSSGYQRLGARPSTRSQQTSTSTQQEEWWIWTWTWTSPAQSWTTWGRKTSTEESLPEEKWNWAQLGMNFVCGRDSKLLFFDMYIEVNCCIHIYCCWLKVCFGIVLCWYHCNMEVTVTNSASTKG